MPRHRQTAERPASRVGRSAGERRSGGAHQGVLAGVVALAVCAWLVVVQHQTPELDASTTRQSMAVLDSLLPVADGGDKP